MNFNADQVIPKLDEIFKRFEERVVRIREKTNVLKASLSRKRGDVEAERLRKNIKDL